MEAGQPQRYDYQYERKRVCNLFMMFEPLAAWRHIEVTNQRTAIDYATQMKSLVDEYYPDATKITIVHDAPQYACSGIFIQSVCPGWAKAQRAKN